jgi:chromosome partitioning protein
VLGGTAVRTIAILNQKGGSGKTTTAVNLAAALAELGKKVLLIDLDPQGSASLWLGLKDKGQPLYNVFVEEGQPILTAVQKTKWTHLDIIPSSPILGHVEKVLASEMAAEMILKTKFEELFSWDYVLIDCPPTLGLLSLNALTFVQHVLIPVEAHVMALHGLVQLMKTVQTVRQRLNPALDILAIVPCRVDFRTKHAQEILSQLHQRFPSLVSKTVIRENVRLAEAPLHISPITHYAPQSKGAEDYRSLSLEIDQPSTSTPPQGYTPKCSDPIDLVGKVDT